MFDKTLKNLSGEIVTVEFSDGTLTGILDNPGDNVYQIAEDHLSIMFVGDDIYKITLEILENDSIEKYTLFGV